MTKAAESQPDLVMLDVAMPGRSGLEVENITVVSPGTRVVLVAEDDPREDLLRRLKAGARGYIAKDTPFPEFVEAVDVAALAVKRRLHRS